MWIHANQERGGCFKDERIGFLLIGVEKSFELGLKMPGG